MGGVLVGVGEVSGASGGWCFGSEEPSVGQGHAAAAAGAVGEEDDGGLVAGREGAAGPR